MRRCASGGRVHPGGTVRIDGANLRDVRRATFHGAAGAGDDVTAPVDPSGARTARARVPDRARSGPLSVRTGAGIASRPSRRVAVMPPPPPPPPTPNAQLSPAVGPSEPGGPAIETSTSATTYFLGAQGGITFSYRLSDEGPISVQVDLVRAADGGVVESWTPPPVTPGQTGQVTWQGVTRGVPQPEGRYAFRLTARDAAGARASSAEAASARDSFDLYQHIFPVRGRHNYGGAGARFGSGRAGHSHQGQDVFASCGTRLVAARGGVVKFRQYHSAAGHYIVIDGDHTGVDYAYMHLTSASPFRAGDRVATGQQIGTVGQSGNARGCHLHFEMWGAPGWYDGGAPFDPLPHLQAWDRHS